MTILDTFTLDFVSKSSQAKKDIADLEKQIDSLRDKGKKRSDEETLQLKEAQKRHKEINQQLKETESHQEKLIEGIAGLVAGYTSLSVIKAGVLDAAAFNRQLSIQSKNLGLNTADLRAYGAEVKALGGNEGAFQSKMFAKSQEFAAVGRTLDVKKYIADVRAALNKPGMTDQGRRQLLGPDGLNVTDPGEYALYTQSPEAAEKADKAFYELTQTMEGVDEDSQAFGASLDKMSTSFRALASNSGGLSVLTNFINGITDKVNQVSKSKSSSMELLAGVGMVGLGAAALGGSLFFPPLAAVGAPLIMGGILTGADASFRAPKGSTADKSSPMVNSDALSFWMAKGYTREQAIGFIAGGETPESGGNAGIHPGDGGAARGLFQYHKDRRDAILAASGKDVWSTNATEAREGAAYEVSHGMRARFDDAYYRTITDPAQAAAYVRTNFETPANGAYEALRAGQRALDMAGQTSLGASDGGNKTTILHIDTVEVNTQATDATGIAADFHDALAREIRTSAAALDDARLY